MWRKSKAILCISSLFFFFLFLTSHLFLSSILCPHHSISMWGCIGMIFFIITLKIFYLFRPLASVSEFLVEEWDGVEDWRSPTKIHFVLLVLFYTTLFSYDSFIVTAIVILRSCKHFRLTYLTVVFSQKKWNLVYKVKFVIPDNVKFQTNQFRSTDFEILVDMRF